MGLFDLTVEECRMNLIKLLSDGEPKTPSDIDELIGGTRPDDILGTPRLNFTFYPEAMTELMEEGIVKWWQDEEGCNFYRMEFK